MKSIIILAILLCTVYRIQSVCTNVSLPYYQPISGNCYSACPWDPPIKYYTLFSNNTCLLTCPNYGFDGNKSCVTSCPYSVSNMTYMDNVNNRCVSQCPANYYAYIGSNTTLNQSCVQNCPNNTYGNDDTRMCVATCPTNTYYYTPNPPRCVQRCVANYYANPINRFCAIGGSCPTSPVTYYSDDTNNMCVVNCNNGTFADSSTGRCLRICLNATFADSTTGKCVNSCPSGYFRSSVSLSCLLVCTQGYYSDSLTGNCTTSCSNGTFADPSTLKCQPTCTAPRFGDPTLNLCVTICSIGLYANNFTQSCVTAINCYANTVADPTTLRCINPINCPNAPYHFANLIIKQCVTRCGSPLWGDRTSKLCVSTCPWSPSTYVSWANPPARQCVTQCPQNPQTFADNYTQSCVSQCTQYPTSPYDTFADQNSQQCVRACPIGFRSQKPQNICVSTCSSNPIILFWYAANQSCISSCPEGTYADYYRQVCTTFCPSDPLSFAYQGNNTCLNSCPDTTYADTSTRFCVSDCPITTLQFADNSTNTCRNLCPVIPDLYGDIFPNFSRICVYSCSNNTFADPVTRLCVSLCSTSLGYYGQNGRCVLNCSSGYADSLTGQCTTNCSEYPIRSYGTNGKCWLICPQSLYGNDATNMCVDPSGCQTGYYADDLTQKCVQLCPLSQATFGESISHRCVKSCPEGQFADPSTRVCNTTCNGAANLFADPSSKRCVASCPSTPNLYADTANYSCVSRCSIGYAFDTTRSCLPSKICLKLVCPSTPPLYADLNTTRCVSSCPRQTFTFANNTFRGCLTSCPQRINSPTFIVDLYADNTTWSCVSLCPQSQNLYNFKHPINSQIRICVRTCPVINNTILNIPQQYFFNENVTQSCVTNCPYQKYLTYGDIFTSKCVSVCSRNQYRDNITARCTYQCSFGLFADNTTWRCVPKCPNGTYAQTTNRTCNKYCPTNFYADNLTWVCLSPCNDSFYWGDNTTWSCVTTCPVVPNLFADPFNKKCEFHCHNNLFVDNFTRKCVNATDCTSPRVGQPITGRCVDRCPLEVPSFKDNSTNTCFTRCNPNEYADNSTMRCVGQCPSNPDYYAYNHTTLGPICVLYCPPNYYRHSPTRECLTSCPTLYYRDIRTMKCLQNCSDYYYSQTNGSICVSICGDYSQYGYLGKCYGICPNNTNADITSWSCVNVCPFDYFAQGGVCVNPCIVGFADPITKVCQSVCSLGYYAKLPQHTCVKFCAPDVAYESNRTCLTQCPFTSNLSTNLYIEPNSMICMNKCLFGWYADNLTRNCSQTCSSSQFADSSTGLCVSKCPQTPDFYGYNGVCYFPCPSNTTFAQNLTRTCISNCPNGSFADSFNRRCMDICSEKQYAFTNYSATPITYTCVEMCPQGLYATDTNKSCVTVCPVGYAQNDTNRCVSKCPLGTYADSHLNVCVSNCSFSQSEFADPSTLRCVTGCPSVPSLYAQNSSRSCVSGCDSSWFAINTTRSCVQNCTQPFFADPISGFCVQRCPIDRNLYADNVSRTCSPTCPNITNSSGLFFTYADNSSKKCVWKCPMFPRLYGINSTNKCESQCPNGQYGDNETRVCNRQCFFGVAVAGYSVKYTWADSTTNFCVSQCPPLYFADNITFNCTQFCTLGYFADNSTWRCVSLCPTNPLSYGYFPTRQCIYECPSPLFGEQISRICQPTCPRTPYFYYRDNIRHRCALNCTYPYYAQVITQSCATECSYGHFMNIAQHQCTKCPESCLTCVAQLNCTSCQPNLYLHIGLCISSCPSFPTRYYANDISSSCTVTCPSPYFGFNGTGKCQITCPQTYYSSFIDNTCQKCPTGCLYCMASNCTSCLPGYIYVSKLNSCSKVCNSTHNYYLNGQCATQCINGTFLLTDLVNCQKCSKECKTCSIAGTNCTQCSSKFWYNYNCIDKCPSNYYVSANFSCIKCTPNATQCVLPPLTFTFKTYTLNYQLYADVVFSRAINLNQNTFAQTAQLRTTKGPIKPDAYTLSRPTSTTYRLRFINSQSFNQLALSIGFPTGFITDDSGMPLTSTTSTTTIPTLSSADPQTKTATANLQNNVNIISWILLTTLVILIFKCSYPLMVLIDTLQLMYMHLLIFIDPRPYTWMNVMKVLSNMHFAFLPQLSKSSIQEPYNPYSGFISQTTFLANCQPFVFIFCIFVGIYILFWVVSHKRTNCYEGATTSLIRKKIKTIFRSRMRYSFIHEIFYYTQLWIVFFACYQFKNYNNTLPTASANIGFAVIVLLLYLVWMITLLYLGSKYRNKLKRLPKKYQFLAYEEYKFPMEVPFKYVYKMVISIVLIIESVHVQIPLIVIVNLLMLTYLIVYRPSVQSLTNYLNIFLLIGFVLAEIILYVYATSSKLDASSQLTTSNALFGVYGVMVGTLVIWIIYRLTIYIRNGMARVQPELSEKIHPIKEEKQLNVSELNIKDEEEQQEDHTQNAQEIAMQFAYHLVPAKTQAQIKAEQALLKNTTNTRRNKLAPLVIEIDEDELIDDNKEDRNKKDKMALTKRSRNWLNIRQDNNQSIEEIDLQSSLPSRLSTAKKHNQSQNQVIWDNLELEESQQSQK